MSDGRERVVVALGGNAFTRPGGDLSMRGQFAFAKAALTPLAPLFDAHHEVLISHGNGPQVGYMLIRVEQALGRAYSLPLEVCVAESEGELGYVLQQSLHNVLAEMGRPRPVVSVLTQVVVDANDPAFSRPTKPIGPFYDRARAETLEAEGFSLVEDAGRGYRRVVPSPMPLEVVEASVLDRLLSAGVTVIAAGGGGIPVVRRGATLHGVDGVVDKDHASALLALRLEARRLVILTGVPCVYTDFGTPEARPIHRIEAPELLRLAERGAFADGSMRPKVLAAASFVTRSGAEALICDPETLPAAMAGRAGTRVVSKGTA